MTSPETSQAASMAFDATVASALARSIRDTPLRARTESAAQALATAEASDARDGSALDDGKEAA
jgi:hypothetical protein